MRSSRAMMEARAGRKLWPWLAFLILFDICCFFRGCHGLTNNMAELNDFFGALSPASKLGWPKADPCNAGWSVVKCSGSDVTEIYIKEMGLTGTLHQSLAQLPLLTRLDAQRNAIGGPLPTFNGTSAPLITTLYLGTNMFTSIPSDFFASLSGITILSLDDNPTLAPWSLPADLSINSGLTLLGLSNCSLVGSIPDSFASLTALGNLGLSYNALTGPLPLSLASTQMRELTLNNQAPPGLSGTLDVLSSMPGLVIAWLHSNSFTGAIPSDLPPGLQDFKINNNKLAGPVPASLSSLTALKTFYAQNNDLSGPLPSLGSVDVSLDTADFCDKTCDPAVLWFLTFLESVSYPQTLTTSWLGPKVCPGWHGVVCDATGTVTSINLPGLQLNGSISPVLSNFSGLTAIVLSNNHLTGVIPDSLTSLSKLTKLDVRNNDLSPPVPVFGPGVTVLTDGNPGLAPALPPAAGGVPPVVPPAAAEPPAAPVGGGAPPLSAPSRSPPPGAGSAPPSGPSPLTPPSKQQQPPSGAPDGKSPSSSPTPGTDGATTSNSSLAASQSSSIAVGAVAGPVAAVVVVILAAGVVLFCCFKKKRRGFFKVPSGSRVMIHPRNPSDPELGGGKGGKGGKGGSGSGSGSGGGSSSEMMIAGVEAGSNLVISIQVLREVTNNFSDDNVLGRGGFGVVYKGQLQDGTMIAVKRMEAAVVSSKGLDEFQAEIAVLTKVRHRHLVALLGYCVEGTERLLVYEYMPQGTLAQHLFDWDKAQEKALPWKKRMSIALDVARGLEYLHGLAHKSFIHRDLKPSNILLGDDFRAKVSDFGLVKLAPDGKYSVETRLAGTFGYLAPEYAVTGRVTTKADVFSFGVVLMELITGRRALDETQAEENMHLVTWFRRTNSSAAVGNGGAAANRDAFIKSVDPAIALALDEETLQTVLIVAELAGHCTAPEPYQRPDMGHAVNVLAPLVELWKPSSAYGDQDDAGGINMELSLPQALQQWQALGDLSMTSSLDDTKTSLPTGFADSFTSADGR